MTTSSHQQLFLRSAMLHLCITLCSLIASTPNQQCMHDFLMPAFLLIELLKSLKSLPFHFLFAPIFLPFSGLSKPLDLAAANSQ